jgi:hypothetical protein
MVTSSGHAEWTRVDVDGRYTWDSVHSRSEVSYLLPRERFARLRRLIAAAGVRVDITCDPADTEGDRETFSVSNYERNLHATYVKPCLAPDTATRRVLECLDSILFGADDYYEFKCRLPPGS